MAKCVVCGKKFDLSWARDEYNAQFDNEIDYDEEFGGEKVCAECAINTTASNISAGKEILDYNDMVHGEIPYDPELMM